MMDSFVSLSRPLDCNFNKGEKILVRDAFLEDGLVSLKKIELSEETAKRASLFLLNPTSIARDKAFL